VPALMYNILLPAARRNVTGKLRSYFPKPDIRAPPDEQSRQPLPGGYHRPLRGQNQAEIFSYVATPGRCLMIQEWSASGAACRACNASCICRRLGRIRDRVPTDRALANPACSKFFRAEIVLGGTSPPPRRGGKRSDTLSLVAVITYRSGRLE
jgi:hypothetical protein